LGQSTLGAVAFCWRRHCRKRWKAWTACRSKRKGGIAGFGGPNLKSRGELALSKLSPADRAAVEGLFKEPQKAGPRGAADAFSYHITRQTGAGPQTIEVPESAVPAVVRDSVKDVLE
jgi:hypothetical protein